MLNCYICAVRTIISVKHEGKGLTKTRLSWTPEGTTYFCTSISVRTLADITDSQALTPDPDTLTLTLAFENQDLFPLKGLTINQVDHKDHISHTCHK